MNWLFAFVVCVCACLFSYAIGREDGIKYMSDKLSVTIDSLREEVNGLMNAFWLYAKEPESISESWNVKSVEPARLSDIHGVV